MAMTVRNTAELAKAGGKNAPLRRALEQWLQAAQAATWKSIRDVRIAYPAADGVRLKAGGIDVIATVFNIKGNEYRLITNINYAAATIVIREVLTHAEYDKQAWKGRFT